MAEGGEGTGASGASGVDKGAIQRPAETIDKGALRLPSVDLHPLGSTAGKGWIAGTLAILTFVAFSIFMYMALCCTLYDPNCHNGVEAINLVAHIFSPILGVIIAFYFAEHFILVIKSSQ